MQFSLHWTVLWGLQEIPSHENMEFYAPVPQEQASTDRYKELHFLISMNCSERRKNIKSQKSLQSQ